MEKNDFCQDILKTIKEENITPKARWQFLCKEYGVWVVGALSFIIGSISFAVMLYMLVHNDWAAREHLADSAAGFVLGSLPHVWIALVALFIFFAHYNLKHTKRGYAYNPYVIVLFTVAGSVVFGTVLYHTGLGRVIDDSLVEHVPQYQKLFQERQDRWEHPERGVLGGRVIVIHDKHHFDIETKTGDLWQVDATRAEVRGEEVGEKIRVIRIVGEPGEGRVFIAEIIFTDQRGPGMKRMELRRGDKTAPSHPFPRRELQSKR